MSQLTIAAKSQTVAYSVLIAATLAADPPSIDYVDEKDVKGGPFCLTVGSKTISNEKEALELLSGESCPDYLILYTRNFSALAPHLEALDSHLNLRSFIAGYALSGADIACFGPLRANPVMGSVVKAGTYANISRWYNLVLPIFEPIVESMAAAVTELRKLAKASSTTKKTGHKANFDIDLPGAEMGRVVTRFPPEPSGYLHIGHAKAAILNEYFAHAYKGKLIIRFDDTNPSKEKTEFEQSIIEDLELLGIKGDTTTYSSDYFDQMYELAIKLIKQGDAYCDNTPLEQMREERMVGTASKCRDQSVEENLKLFDDMKQGSESGVTYCLRAKMDYAAPNKALRDPVIYRCNKTPHHRTGTAWKMYPTYDFCVPIVDSIEGVTHALRTNEYRDRNPQYKWFIDTLNLRPVNIWDFGRVNFVRTLLSKRKLQWFVDEHLVPNWDDPRFPTVRGVRRRGMTVEGLRNFILAQGPSKNIINLDWLVIWALNKKVIDPVAPRFTAVEQLDAVPVTIAGAPATPVHEKRPRHKKNADLGEKTLVLASTVLIDQADAKTLDVGEEITFMDWGNVIINNIARDGETVTSIEATLHLEGDYRKTSKKITWLAETPDKVELDLVDFDHLITKDKLEEDDNFADFLTPVTETHTKAFGDLNVGSLPEGSIIQLERKGYFRVDVAASNGKPAVLFTIPDGKTVSKYGAKQA